MDQLYSLYTEDREGEEIESSAWIAGPNATVKPTVQRSGLAERHRLQRADIV
ncbi:MAG: hypothetical protein JNK32_01860 [Anaerolineales bacterium]|nr:hypothetical protein [Anaerolineales bacterium]